MIAVLVALWQAAAVIGLGAALLRILGVCGKYALSERLALSFATGLGILGWLLFLAGAAGLFNPTAIVVILLGSTAGLLLLDARPDALPRQSSKHGGATVAMGVLLLAALAFDVLEALAPPADADSLAYHFALPKLFLEEGRLVFVPRAVDGAVPLLLQLTGLPALALGGELALTLWSMLTGWAAGALLYLFARRHMEPVWALSVVAIYLTTPAILYGAGSGQVEPRMALFVLLLAWALSASGREASLANIALAGLAAGFCAGSKYFGLLMIAAAMPVVLWRRDWLYAGMAFGVCGFVAGCQWYVWNWINTGDPLFPVLYAALALPDSEIWSAAQQARFMRTYVAGEQGMDRSLLGLALYPILATFRPPAEFDAGRVGLGLYPFLVWPFALLGLLQVGRTTLIGLRAATVLAVLYFILWFFLGSSQRVRHLVPILPLFLVVATALATRIEGQHIRRPMTAAVAAILVMQLVGQVLFSAQFIQHLAARESRDAFLARNVNLWAMVDWINSRLTREDKVLFQAREISYLVDIPYVSVPSLRQTLLNIEAQELDSAQLFSQLKRYGITHIVVREPDMRSVSAAFSRLVERACVVPQDTLVVSLRASRTLSFFGAPASAIETVSVFHVRTDDCLP